ncbi:unnamed protein product [Caenorhabditis brenneri]
MEERWKDAEKLIYTLSDPATSSNHDCVVVLNEHHAAAYTADDQIDEGQEMTIFNYLDKNIKVEVSVVYKDANLGYLVFKTLNDYEFGLVPDVFEYAYVPKPYHQLAISNGTFTWSTGRFVKTDKYHIRVFGNTDGMCGDVIFDKYASFVGIVTKKEDGKIVIVKSEVLYYDIGSGPGDDVELTESDYI